MKAMRKPRRQSGGFLLEALIGILIFAFGVLGIVGLQGMSLRVTNESQYRAEVAYLANSLLAQMWADDYAQLKNRYDSGIGGAGYSAFAAKVKAQLGAVWVEDPIVQFDDAKAPSAQSSYVTITVKFMLPGTSCASPPCNHQYVTSGVVGTNL